MSLVINTNTSSINAQRQILRLGSDLDKSTERLSSGRRINSASDDAAGLAISNRMTSQSRGLQQAIRNANDGISLILVAEGALNETTNMLQRIRELSLQASNGIYSNNDRATLNAEVKQLLSQVDLIAKNTQFNGRSILDGSTKSVALQVGSEDNQAIEFKIPKLDTKSLGLGSTSGDLVGAQMSVSNTGTLSSAIPSDAIKINGKSIGAFSVGSKVQDVLDAINNSIDGVEATSIVNIKATAQGSGVLTGGKTLSLSGVGLDGNTVSFVISDTTSLDSLAEKINTQTSNTITATVDDGKLILTSSKFSTLSAVDATGGKASGINIGVNADQNITDIVNALQTSWIAEAESLISTYYGLEGNGSDLTLDLTSLSDGLLNTIASVSWTPGPIGTNLHLNLDMADFTPANVPNGNLVAGSVFTDRIIAHELVHAVMTTNMDMSGLPGWFKEGAAEFIVGADERVKGDLASLSNQAAFNAAYAAAAVANPAALGYSVGYLAVKMMHAEIKNAGGAGISEVFAQLAAGQTFSNALAAVSGAHAALGALWTDATSFDARVQLKGYDFMTGVYLPGVVNLQGAGVAELDTGSIAGSDFGGSAKDNASIIPDISVAGPQHFNFVVAPEYGGGSINADAQLILTSKTGEKIQVTKGGSGTDSLLNSLGFVESSSSSIVGGKLTSANQQQALAVGDLKINGVDIGATQSSLGLTDKVAAINAKIDETGVTAKTTAKIALTTNNTVHTEFTGTVALSKVLVNDVIGINGLGISVVAGETLDTVAKHINNAYTATGAKAYVDDAGKIHIYSNGPLNFSHGNVSAPSSGFFNDIGIVIPGDSSAAGSVNIKGTNVTLTNIYDKAVVANEINAQQAKTGVYAKINDNGQLELKSDSAFTLKLGSTNGLKTFEALGVTSGFATSGFDLSDTNSDKALTDETVNVLARIELASLHGETIQVETTSNGSTATGLLNQNTVGSSSLGTSLSSLNVLTVESAQKAVKTVDMALTTINNVRSNLGAVNNRLDFTVTNLTNIVEKTSAALSRIVDADFAQETAKLSRATVLQQAAQAMLAQANSRPNQVLSLLR